MITDSELAARLLPYLLRNLSTTISASNTTIVGGGGVSAAAAGAGLTFSSGVLNVGAGSGITVNADDVALTTPGTLTVSTANVSTGSHTHGITTSANPGANASILASDPTGYLQLVRLGASVAPQLPLHSRSASGAQLRLDYDASNYADFTVGGGGNLTVAPLGDFVFAPGGDDINPQSTYRYNIGSLTQRYLTLHAAELWVQTLVAEEVRSTTGGRLNIAPTTELIAALTASGASYNSIAIRGTATSDSTAGGSLYSTIALSGTVQTGSATGAGGTLTPAFVGASSNADYTASLVVNRPSGVQNNDVMICIVAWWIETLTMPSGWTQIGNTITITDGEGTRYVRAYRRVASSEGATYTFGLSDVMDISVTIAAYRNVDTTTPIDVTPSDNQASSTSASADSITTVTAGAMLIHAVATMDTNSGATGYLAPSGYTERADSATSIWARTSLSDRLQTSAGATGTVTGALDEAEQYGAFLIALRPATGSGNTQVSINVPSNTAGNTLIAAIFNTSTQTITADPAWTLIDTRTGANGTMNIYRHTVASGDASSYTWQSNTTGTLRGWIAEFSGVDTSRNAVVLSRSNAASTSITSPNITPTTNADMLLFVAGAIDASAGSRTITPPSGMTERSDAGSDDIRGYLATELLSSAGSVGVRTATLSGSEANVCALVALAPSANSGTSSVTPALPTGTTTGDVVVALVSYAGTPTVTPGTGYTLAFTQAGANGGMAVYYRVIQSGDTAQTWTINTNGALGVALSAWTNVDSYATFDTSLITYQSQSNSASTSMTAPSIAPIVGGTVGLFLGAAIDGSAGSSTITPPSGMTERRDAGAGDVRLYVASEALAATGPTGTRVATISTSEANVAAFIALRPSAAAGNTIDVKHNNLNAGDILHMEARGRIEYMQVTSGYSAITGGYRYTVIRNLDGTGANAWEAGDAVVNTGQPGTGWIDAYAQSSMQSQAIDYIYNSDGGVFGGNLQLEPSWTMWAAAPATNDAIYFGVANVPWSNVYIQLGTAATGTSLATAFEYWNGSTWAAVSGLTTTGAITSTGFLSYTWNPAAQTGWTTTSVNSQTAYWVRLRVTGGTWTTAPVTAYRRVHRGTRQWGPTMVGWVRSSYLWNDFVPRWAIGNLDGLYDYGTTTFGAAFGDYSGAWIGVDATNGLRLMSNTTAVLQINQSGGQGTISGPLYLSNTTGGLYQGTGTFAAPITGLKISATGGQGYIAQYIDGGLRWQSNGSGISLHDYAYRMGDSLFNPHRLLSIYNASGAYIGTLTAFNSQTALYGQDGVILFSNTGPNYLAVDSTQTSTIGPIYAGGAITTASTISPSGGALLPRSGGSAVFGIDCTTTGASVTIANEGTATPFGSQLWRGLLIVNETAVDGSIGLFTWDIGSVTEITDSSGIYTGTAGTANSVNIYAVSNVLTIQNRRGGSRTFNVFAIRTS